MRRRSSRPSGSFSLVRPAVAGTLATALVAAGAAQPGSPFALKHAHAWFFGIPGATTDVHRGMVLGLLAVYGGVGILVVVWYQLAQALRCHPGFPVRRLAPLLALWALPILVAPPLFSQDVYIYAAVGAMVSHGVDPYHVGTVALGASPYGALVDPFWRTHPSPYGPLFLAVAATIVNLTFRHVLATVAGLRVLEVASVAVLAVCATRLARLYRRDPAEVFALAVLNPVTLLLLVGSAHNDAFMLALLASGLLLAKRGRPALGILLCSLAAAVKFPAGLGVLYIAWGWLGPRAGWRDRLRPLLTALLICFCVMEVLARATGLGWGWLGALGTPGTVRTWLDPSTAIGLMGSAVSRFLGIGPSEALILSVTRGAGDVLAVAVCVALLWHSPRLGRAKTLGLGLLTVVALGPIIQPWYFSWGIVVLAPVAAGRLRAAVIGLSVFAVLLPLQDGGAVLGPLGVAAAVVALVGVVLVVSRPGPFVVPTRRALARLGVPRGASDP